MQTPEHFVYRRVVLAEQEQETDNQQSVNNRFVFENNMVGRSQLLCEEPQYSHNIFGVQVFLRVPKLTCL